jgi:hypothetical protein
MRVLVWQEIDEEVIVVYNQALLWISHAAKTFIC